jgi:hypothetical protein
MFTFPTPGHGNLGRAVSANAPVIGSNAAPLGLR